MADKPSCDNCGDSGWMTRLDQTGVSMAPCGCKGGPGPQAVNVIDLGWYLNAGNSLHPDGLGRLVCGILKDGRHVIGVPFTPEESVSLSKPGRNPTEVTLFILFSEIARLRARVDELEKLVKKG